MRRQELLARTFLSDGREVWLGLLACHDVPAGPLNRLDEAFDDPAVRHLGLVRDVAPGSGTSMRLLGSAVSVSDFTPGPFAMPPSIGEQTHELLREVGVSVEDLEALLSAGIIKPARGVRG